MHIQTTWHGDQFNVELAANEKAEAFLSIKGCRLAQGDNGPFVGWPATKNPNTGKWWRHVWSSDKFAAAVLEKALATQPRSGGRRSDKVQADDDSIPF